MTMLTLTPAYGRDYTSKAKVQADLDADRDFILQPEGRYINRAQLVELGKAEVRIRYAKLRKVAVFTVSPVCKEG